MLPKCIQNPSIIESKFIRDPFKIHTKSVPNPSKIHRKSIPNPSKIHPKSTLGCECAFGANQGGPGNEKGDPLERNGCRFGDHFRSKIKKVAPRWPKGNQKSGKRASKSLCKNICRKSSEKRAKSFQHMPKRMPKSLFFNPKWMNKSM